MGSLHRRRAEVWPLAIMRSALALMSADAKRGKQFLNLITHKIQLIHWASHQTTVGVTVENFLIPTENQFFLIVMCYASFLQWARQLNQTWNVPTAGTSKDELDWIEGVRVLERVALRAQRSRRSQCDLRRLQFWRK